MTIKSCFSLVEEAKQKIKSINFKNALKLHNEGETTFIDLRDIRELEKNGKIKNAKHVPRGMLEFGLTLKVLIIEITSVLKISLYFIVPLDGDHPYLLRQLWKWV